ncbi:hypothetical protein V8C34DRAFT_280996 [Trichoderma compactum]
MTGAAVHFRDCWTISFFFLFSVLSELLPIGRYKRDIHVHCKAGLCRTPIGRLPCHRRRNKQKHCSDQILQHCSKYRTSIAATPCLESKNALAIGGPSAVHLPLH